MKGVIDRFEGEYAIIVLDDGSIVNIHKKQIPYEAKEGDVIKLLKDKAYIDLYETEKRKKEINKYLDLWE